MKKALTALWIIIIIGIAFMAFHYFRPKAADDGLTNVENDPDVIIKEEAAIDPDTPKTYREYLASGDQYLASAYTAQAVESYLKATRVKPDSSEAFIKLGTAYLADNQTDKALEAFNMAAQLNPNSIAAKVNLARAHLNARQVEKARDIIWSLDENNLDAKYYRAIISILAEDFESAETFFKEIASLQTPENLLPQAEKSLVFLDAFTTFSYYKEGDPLFLQLLLAKALTDNAEYQAAIPLLFDIINQKNNYRDAWIVLGFAYLNTGKAADAIDALTQAEALNSQKPETLFFLGLAYFANDEIDKAIAYIEKADEVGYQPKSELDLKLADLYLLQKNYEKSAAQYEKVLALNKSNIGIYIRGVWLNIDKLANPDRALELALESIEQHPDNAMSYNLVGWANTALGEYDKATESLNIALQMDPQLDAANLNFGWLHEKLGNSILAKEYYKKAYILGQGNSIGNLAAIRFNKLSDAELSNFYKVNISAPATP